MRYFIPIITLLMLLSCSRPKVIFIDDVVKSKAQLEKLDTSEIFSYTKYFPEKVSAPRRYYKGQDTIVIVVKTKKVETSLQKQRHALLSRFLDSMENGADILVVEDGILILSDSQKSLRVLSPDQLSSVDTMGWQAAKELYGSWARPMTLIVNLYRPRFNNKP